MHDDAFHSFLVFLEKGHRNDTAGTASVDRGGRDGEFVHEADDLFGDEIGAEIVKGVRSRDGAREAGHVEGCYGEGGGEQASDLLEGVAVEGMKMMCGAEPDPLCSTCQVIPSSVWT